MPSSSKGYSDFIEGKYSFSYLGQSIGSPDIKINSSLNYTPLNATEPNLQPLVHISTLFLLLGFHYLLNELLPNTGWGLLQNYKAQKIGDALFSIIQSIIPYRNTTFLNSQQRDVQAKVIFFIFGPLARSVV